MFTRCSTVYKKEKICISREPTEFPFCVWGGNCLRQFNKLRFSETLYTSFLILTEKKERKTEWKGCVEMMASGQQQSGGGGSSKHLSETSEIQQYMGIISEERLSV